jgi:putative transposase
MVKQTTITMDEGTHQELMIWSKSTKLEHRYVLRSKLILMRSEGKSYDEIQQRLDISRPVVAKWIRRFRAHGIDGLFDSKRPGKPSKYSDSDVARVLKLVTTKPPGGYTSWSQRRLAQETGMSQSKIHRILNEQNLKPHKVDYWCGKSPDPEFESKMLDIVGLYLNPPENALVLCVDEKTQMQALDRTQPQLPLSYGNPKRLTATYKRNGTVSLIAALSVHEGEITANTMEKNNAENFLKFLKKLDRKYTNKKLHIIVDNLSVHKHQFIKDWLKGKRKIQLHFTPTYSSWLNQIEIWFNIFTRDVLYGGVWQSKQQLVDQIMEYIKTYNNTRAKPFQWTYNGRTSKS